MNRLHDVRGNEARLEDRLQEDVNRPSEPELAADWAFKKELGQLAAEPLPAELRHNILRQTRRFPRHWASGLAMAACITAMLLISHGLQPPEPDITPAEAESFQLAMQTISTASELAFGITGRELNEHMGLPTIDLAQWPYGEQLQSIIAPETEINEVEIN